MAPLDSVLKVSVMEKLVMCDWSLKRLLPPRLPTRSSVLDYGAAQLREEGEEGSARARGMGVEPRNPERELRPLACTRTRSHAHGSMATQDEARAACTGQDAAREIEKPSSDVAREMQDKAAAESCADMEKEEDAQAPAEVVEDVVSVPASATFTVASMSLITTMLPTIAKELDGQSNYAWVGTGYLLSSTALAPAWGSLSDIFGLKIVIIFNIVEFLIFTAICGASTSMTMLIVGRIMQGVGGGAIIALSFVVIGAVIPPAELGKYTGLLGAIAGSTAAVGPLIGGIIVDHLNWRWGFFIVLPFSAVSLVGAFMGLKVEPPKGTFRQQILRVDYLGLVLLTGACTALLLALSWGGGTYAWVSGEVIGSFVVAVVLLVAFLWWETKFAREPIMPLELFKSWNYVVSVITLFFGGWAIYGLSYFIPLYFQTVRGMTATESGVNNLPFTAFMIVASVGAGVIVTRTGQYRFFPAIGLALIAVGTGIFYLWDTDSSTALELLPQMVAGTGVGIVLNVAQMIAQTSVPKKVNGPATTTANFLRLLGGAIGIAAFQTVFSNVLKSRLPGYFVTVATDFRLSPEQLGLYSSYLNTRYSPQRTDISSIPTDAIAALNGAYIHATVEGLRVSFISGTAVVGLGVIFALFVRHVPLKKTVVPVDEV
ncbi:MFS general substrate transporter [Gonapodya prolifera JEL478]|uniref:MFS general substrate transporter n=1 Tax=Gonapodya prolifera (strain JEL478) TaxID=1344416 RepID=A0A139APM7_GONPJ|nr:MFS general substrate transporter [Gonapodya prolifera JEL478]|eukprot:KXS18700.1 MFS general substrate transporter [Gonapodya prolifera JEL478]